ncbi:MAG: HEAT repeat domain-containing protein, partial [Gemmatales bacterium]|nr:HEAT repeat domain-containing protein [Gemmatales bacterium]MDW8386166.1 HEAT repeat domain-containing protein [Gemmatales bacterium]
MTRFVVGVLTAAVVLVVHFGAVLQAQQGVGFLGKSLADWGRDLTSSDPAVRRAAAFAIGNKGPEAQGWASRLSALLDDPDPTVRDAAAFALGKIGPPASLSAQKKLESLLAKDPSAYVRRSAAYALGRLGPNGASSAGALAQALKDAEPSVRQNAAYALGELGPDVLLFHNAKLADLLRDPDPLVRRDAAVALGRGGPASAAAVPQLIAALSDADTGVRLNAAIALGNIGPAAAQAIPALTRMIRERANDRDVWREAVVALPKIGPGNAGEIIPGMRPALNHPDPAVRKSAALSFFQHADSEAARASLMDMIPLLKDDDVEVRRAAAAFFSNALKHPDPAFDPVWQPLLEAI